MSDLTVQAGRTLAERHMVDEVTITRPAAQTLNATTGEYESATGSEVYAGKARLAAPTVVQPEAGDGEVEQNVVDVWIPLTADPVLRGDVVEVTAARVDASLVGRTLRVVAVLALTDAARRTLRCEVVL